MYTCVLVLGHANENDARRVVRELQANTADAVERYGLVKKNADAQLKSRFHADYILSASGPQYVVRDLQFVMVPVQIDGDVLGGIPGFG